MITDADCSLDWGSTLRKRFSWRTFKFEWGRYWYKTNAFGDTIRCKWIWESEEKELHERRNKLLGIIT